MNTECSVLCCIWEQLSAREEMETERVRQKRKHKGTHPGQIACVRDNS